VRGSGIESYDLIIERGRRGREGRGREVGEAKREGRSEGRAERRGRGTGKGRRLEGTDK